MSSDWLELKLDEIAYINPTRTIPRGSDAPFVEMAALPTNSRDIDNNQVVLKAFAGGGAKFKNGDTLLARITPCLENGKTAFVSNLPCDVSAFGSTEFIVLSPKLEGDRHFLYYLVRSEEFRKYAISRMEGTSGRQRVPNSAIANYEFTCPPLEKTRQAIGKLLNLLDDRIASLAATNTTLEAIAQAMFKSWFVDFDPVSFKQQGQIPLGMDEETAKLFPDSFDESESGLVPSGWKIQPLQEVYEINPQRKLKKASVAPYLEMASVNTSGHTVGEVTVREFGSGTKFINGDTLLARITPCLENGKTAFVDFLNDGETGWGSTEFIVLRPKQPLPPYHGYLLSRYPTFREYAIQSMSGTSGRQRVQIDVLGKFLVAVPDDRVALAFGSIIEIIQKKITSNQVQAKTLASIRDKLLPQLISGKIRIPDFDRHSEPCEAI